jgi:hypothetical protein
MKFRKIKSPATKTIEFKLHSSLDERVYDLPTPAKFLTPQWFKELPSTVEDSPMTVQPSNLTLKTNLPFVDPFSLGYMAVSPYDIELLDRRETLPVEMKNNPTVGVPESPALDFSYPGYPIIEQSDFVHHFGWKVPTGFYDDVPYSWNFWFTIHTPPGYSVLITNPLNNNTLPWFTTNIVVDTDKNLVLDALPFFISKSASLGIIPKGTPLFQIIPFKRDNWVRKVAPITENNLQTHRSSTKPAREAQMQVPNVWYKQKIWNEKNFN